MELVATFAMLDFDNAVFSFRRVEPPLVLMLQDTDDVRHTDMPLQLKSTSQARTRLNVLGNEVSRLLKELSTLAERSTTEDGMDRKCPRFWCYVHTLSHSVELGRSSNQILSRKRNLEAQLHESDAALLSFNAHATNKNNRT